MRNNFYAQQDEIMGLIRIPQRESEEEEETGERKRQNMDGKK